jgi:hypothetical protein
MRGLALPEFSQKRHQRPDDFGCFKVSFIEAIKHFGPTLGLDSNDSAERFENLPLDRQ